MLQPNRREFLGATALSAAALSLPRYAFAAFVRGGGRAEWGAALVVHALAEGLLAVEQDRERSRNRPW